MPIVDGSLVRPARRPARRRARRVGAQYVALATTWGVSFLLIKVGLEGLSPGQVVLGRLGAGAVALLVVCVATRQPLPRDVVVWGHLLVVAVLLCVLPFLLFAWAEQHVTSATASVVNASTPLMTAAVAVLALPQERLTRLRLLGLTVGFAGVVVLLAPWQVTGVSSAGSSPDSGWGRLACLGATASYGVAFVYLRRFVSPLGLPAVPVATVQVGLGAAVMLVSAPWLAWQPVMLTWRVVVAMTALGVLGTGLAYVWNTNVVAGWGATSASTVTYLTPLVGVLAGAVVLGEPVGWSEPVGAAVVVLGIAFSQGRFRRPVTTAWLTPVGRSRGRRGRGRSPGAGPTRV